MTLAVVERVLQAAQSKLDAIAIEGLVVERNRSEAVDCFPALVLHDGNQVANEEQTVFVMRVRTIEVEGFIRVTDKANLGPELNALYAETVKALTSDVSLNGTAVDVAEVELLVVMDPQSDTLHQGQFSLKFDVTYTTKQGDPYTIAP